MGDKIKRFTFTNALMMHLDWVFQCFHGGIIYFKYFYHLKVTDFDGITRGISITCLDDWFVWKIIFNTEIAKISD